MKPEHKGDAASGWPERPDSRGLRSVGEIKKAAEDEQLRLLAGSASKWADAYENAQAQEPLFVVGREQVYYLVEFRKGEERATGLMLLNPYNANVGAVTGIQKAKKKILFYQPAEIPQLLDQRNELVRTERNFPPAARVTIRKDDVWVAPDLYWDACDQSVTPFKPFYVVTHRSDTATGVGSHGIVDARLFVRVDGKVFSEITFGGAGM